MLHYPLLELGRMVGNVSDYVAASWHGDPVECSHQAFASHKYVYLLSNA